MPTQLLTITIDNNKRNEINEAIKKFYIFENQHKSI